MSNRLVPAADGGMPAITRRQALRTLAVGSAVGALAAGSVVAVSPSPAMAEPIGAELAAAIERHRVALAAQEAAGRVHGAREQAMIDRPGDAATGAAFEAADDAFNASCGREQDAHNAVIAAPIMTLADMRTKAAYLASVSRHMIHDGDTMAALLASMGAGMAIMVIPSEPDPAHEALTRYHQHVAAFNEPTNGISDDELNTLRNETWAPFWEAVEDDPSLMPAATTLAGALLALRTMISEQNLDGFEEGCLRSALAYFDGRA